MTITSPSDITVTWSERQFSKWRADGRSHPVWKIGNYSSTQILREIEFCEYGVSTSVILTILALADFDYGDFLLFVRAKIQISKIIKKGQFLGIWIH